jgi:hypothetical protein
LPLAQLAPLLARDADWVCLQRDVRSTDAATLRQDGRVAFHAEALADFPGTAALIAQLDLVISVDTSIAHLAGSLGKPVWVMLSHNPDWRWLRERQDNPWYPGARLFRQATAGDWPGVLARLEAALAERFG